MTVATLTVTSSVDPVSFREGYPSVQKVSAVPCSFALTVSCAVSVSCLRSGPRRRHARPVSAKSPAKQTCSNGTARSDNG